MKVTKKILTLAAIPTLLLLIGVGISAFVTQRGNDQVSYFLSTVVDRQSRLSTLFYRLGYGEGIHAFKNYVIRHDEKYHRIALQSFEAILKDIQEYLTIKDLTSKEKRMLDQLSTTIMEYKQKLPIAKAMIENGSNTTEIDQAVKVDDSAAVKAISEFNSEFLIRREHAINMLNSAQDLALYMITMVMLLALILAIIMSRKVARGILKSLHHLMGVSKSIESGNYRLQKPRDNGNHTADEFDELESQFSQMSQKLDLAFTKIKKSNSDLEQFAFIASHDLQEPLKKITSYAELLEITAVDRLNNDEKHYIETIITSADHLLGLTHSLLEYSRLIRNEELVYETVSLNEVIDSCIETQSANIDHLKAQITREDLPTVICNRNLIEVFFRNLISNSLKYSKPNTPPKIEIKAVKDAQLWQVHLYDNGIGFDPSQASQMLKPFGRAHAKNTSSGYGIGLSTCQKIAEIHQSKLELQGTPGVGAEFSISLKAA